LIDLEAYGEAESMKAVADRLEEHEDVSRVRLVDAARSGFAVVSATIHARAVDEVLDDLRRLGVPEADLTLTRVEVLGRSSPAASTRRS
jgi:hypothetical protein